MGFKNNRKILDLIFTSFLYLVIVFCIFIFSEYFYVPIKDNRGVEYIYSRIIFIIRSINIISLLFIIYSFYSIFFKKNILYIFILVAIFLFMLYLNVLL